MRSSADSSSGNLQLTMFEASNPALDALRSIDVESLSPLEAITKLFELKRLTGEN